MGRKKKYVAEKICGICGESHPLWSYYNGFGRYRDKCKPCIVGRIRTRPRRTPLDRKDEARRITTSAVRRGEIINPGACEECGATGVRIEGHHWSYTEPWQDDVEWLCKRCHVAADNYRRKIEQIGLFNNKQELDIFSDRLTRIYRI